VEFRWDEKKNALLQEKRGVSFEDIVSAIAAGNLVDVLKHPNRSRYPNQQLYLVNYHGYIHVVPVEMEWSSQTAYMKTIFRSRKYNKEYL
jgi:uncharacterized DUF497 family protein